ncbi:hypothetical protein LSUB1_G008006 [Lachnellula subtilissima]|uniref:RRM domain-containing protein n=1 Tax=Lachnellula subtilissima TaxID=602034 RepID=A0A8H8RFR4_9HELO|nr:hypothetical protein LSUB1_G008006 [Lachnellula subtilissima]
MEDNTLVGFKERMMSGVKGTYPQEEINAVFGGYEDVWLSSANLHPDNVIPCIPKIYRQQHEEHRAIYVAGFTFACDCKDFLRWARSFGGAQVERTVTIVDTESQCTFRWLIMPTAEDAATVLGRIHEMEVTMWQPHRDGTEDVLKFSLRVCYSAIDLFVYNPLSSACYQPKGSLSAHQSVSTVHGHPSPPENLSLQGLSLQDPAPIARAISSISPVIKQERVANSTSDTPGQSSYTPASSWASIALTANPDSEIINLHPPARAFTGPRVKPAGRFTGAPSVISDEPMVDQARVVFLLDMPRLLTLQEVSDAVIEGPLRSITFSTDESNGKPYVGIIFQYAQDSESFYQVLCKERADSRPGRFKFVVDAIRGDPFPMDANIKAMGSPTYATRRLTMVKSRFFFMVNERSLRQFCEKYAGVGPDMIQLVWIYNGGNATIVFADVGEAIKVKSKLDDYSMGIGVLDRQAEATWAGLQTTFSKDPCVAPLELKTAMT